MPLVITIEEFIGKSAVYDKEMQTVFGVQEDGSVNHLLDIREWSRIQGLFAVNKRNYSEKKAMEFADEFGTWVAKAISEKLQAPPEPPDFKSLLKALAGFHTAHTPEKFSYIMQDINQDWDGYLNGKYLFFIEQPMAWLFTLTDSSLEKVAKRLLELKDANLSS